MSQINSNTKDDFQVVFLLSCFVGHPVVGIGAFRVLMRLRPNIEPSSPLKPTKVGFIFIGPNSLSRVEDLAVVNHVIQVRVGY